MAEAIDYAPNPLELLQQLANAPNVADLIDDGELNGIGADAKKNAESDLKTMAEWKEAVDWARGLAGQEIEEKMQGSRQLSNIKMPMLMQASLEFGAQAYQELLGGENVVEGWFPGVDEEQSDPQAQQANEVRRARMERATKFLNWQLEEGIESWEEGVDQLLCALSIDGCLHRMTWTDNDQVCSKTILCDDLIVAQWQSYPATRITRKFRLTANEVWERKQAGLFRDLEYQDDEDEMFVFYEQHSTWDLDDDGYEEPYIVTYDEGGKVARVAARYRFEAPEQTQMGPKVVRGRVRFGDVEVYQDGRLARIHGRDYFTRYGEFPSTDGTYWWRGLGHLMSALVDLGNTLANQLVDSGTLAASGGGVIDQRLELNGGDREITREPGRYLSGRNKSGQNLSQLIHDWPTQEPSQTLFALLGLVKEMADGIPAVVRFSADGPANMAPMTMQGYLEAGQVLFGSIYKRLRRALSNEFQKIAECCYYDADLIMHDYVKVLNAFADPAADFAPDMDVVPTAKKELSTGLQRIAKAKNLLDIEMGLAALQDGGSGMERVEVVRRVLESLSIDDVDELFPPPPSPEQQAQMEQSQMRDMKLADVMKQAEVEGVVAETEKRKREVGKLEADTEKVAADTEIARAEAVIKRQEQTINRLEALIKAIEVRRADVDVAKVLAEVANTEADTDKKRSEAAAQDEETRLARSVT